MCIRDRWNDYILKSEHQTLQDSNDRFLANIQRDGTYSVVPRVPGGEITPEKLIVLGVVARKYNLYTKITGGQRIDLFGARVEQLPAIWERLIDAGFDALHIGKAFDWLAELQDDSHGAANIARSQPVRIYAPEELDLLDAECRFAQARRR